MKTSDRKNAKRLKALTALAARDSQAFDAERRRLLEMWTAEIWRRVRDKKLPPADVLLKIAEQFGLGEELEVVLNKAVRAELGGPAFISRSVIRPRNLRPDLVAAWEKNFGS